MHEGFSHAINTLHDRLTEPVAINEPAYESLLEDLEHHLGGQHAAEQIRDMQIKKEAIMQELQNRLTDIEQGASVGEKGKSRSVDWDESRHTTVVYGPGGETLPISTGQLATAKLWDEDYFLASTVPRSVKKTYAITAARYQIATLYDQQITLSEMHKSYNRNTGLDDAYAAVYDRLSSSELPDGIIAEKMVESYLTKLMYDHDMPYRIKSVSVYEDVEYKIDFIIEPKYERDAVGVKVTEPEARADVGIQFTTSQSHLTQAHKEKQLEHSRRQLDRTHEVPIHNLILVTLPLEHVRETYELWQQTKPTRRTPGGPDELWPEHIKEQVFSTLLERVLPPERVARAWEGIR